MTYHNFSRAFMAGVAALGMMAQSSPAADHRSQPPKDLNGYFPWNPDDYPTEDAWKKRSEKVRLQMKVALGLWPEPPRTPLKAQVYGRIEPEAAPGVTPTYSVEKVTFEALPGLFVTGNLYRPTANQGAKGADGKRAAVLCPHGHWNDGRFLDSGVEATKKEIAAGAELFENGGRSVLQARCVQLARMGCVVFHYDMLGYADSVQIGMEVAHKFAKIRPELHSPESWGLFSPQAESWLQSVLGLQAWFGIRSLDFLATLPDVDTSRIGVTGASGGGTQTFVLGAIDPRPAALFPAVMVGTAMQGGCTCENCSLFRIGTGNIEFAALAAPKPVGMTAADDWTKEMTTKGFPQLKAFWTRLGAADKVSLTSLTQFPHNYNAPSRAAMYAWFNKHLGLNLPEPALQERDYPRLDKAALTVWDAEHPAPSGEAVGEAFEKKLCRQLKESAESAVKANAASARSGWEAIIGRTPEDYAAITLTADMEAAEKINRGDWTEIRSVVVDPVHHEEIPATFLLPTNWNGHVALWIDGQQSPQPAAEGLVRQGMALVLPKLLKSGEPNPVVANPRQAPCYTYGYNHPLLAQRVHDVLGLIKFVTSQEKYPVKSVSLIGLGPDGAPLAAAVKAVAGQSLQKVALETSFRWISLTDYRDARFLPGASRYGDLPGALAVPGAEVKEVSDGVAAAKWLGEAQ